MKIKCLWAEFAVVFLFLVIPPLLVNKSTAVGMNYTFSLLLPAQTAIAFLLDFQERHRKPVDDSMKTGRSFIKMTTCLSWGAITTGCLMLIFALFELTAYIFPRMGNSGLVDSKAPSTISGWLVCIMTIFVGAYYEETVYRQFLPNTLILLCGTRKWKKVAIELSSLLLFAFSHRYLGWMAVLNAALCGFVLRICRKKTGSVYTGTIAHIIYNTIMYALLLI